MLSDQMSLTVQSAVREAVSVARSEGLETDDESVLAIVRKVAEATRRNTSSMLQDVQKRRRPRSIPSTATSSNWQENMT